MSTYRQQVEEEIVAELRTWLDTVEEEYGPNYALEGYAFLAALGFTPEGEEPEPGQSFARSAIDFRCSDPRRWRQVGLLRQALRMTEEANGQD